MIYFREVQRLWVWVMLLLLLATPVIILTTALRRIPANRPISERVLYMVYGPLALVAILFSLGRLITEVRETELSIRFSPLWPERTIRWDEIRRVEAVTYSPIQCGG